MSFAFCIMVHMNAEKNTRHTHQIITSTGQTKLFTGNTSKCCFMYLQFFLDIYIYKTLHVLAPHLVYSPLEKFSQAPSTFLFFCCCLIYNPEVQPTTLKCLFTAGMKQNQQLGLEVKAPNGLLQTVVWTSISVSQSNYVGVCVWCRQ